MNGCRSAAVQLPTVSHAAERTCEYMEYPYSTLEYH